MSKLTSSGCGTLTSLIASILCMYDGNILTLAEFPRSYDVLVPPSFFQETKEFEHTHFDHFCLFQENQAKPGFFGPLKDVMSEGQYVHVLP